MPKRRFIVHVDMDAFFAAIEERDNPKLRAKPIVVGADPKRGMGRGVVSTCSYEARKFGIHSAMPISIAYRKCPHAVFLPVNMEKYAEVSHQIYDLLYEFTPEIEPVSIDEAFLDITGSYHLFGPSIVPGPGGGRSPELVEGRSPEPVEGRSRTVGTPQETCLLIKSRIKQRTALTASVGLAPTKMAAKIASDLKKPDGFVEVTEDGLLDFLHPLDISKIWALGKKSEAVLRQKGINAIGDIAGKEMEELINLFGKNGANFWRLARGIDTREVEGASAAKSVGNEITFEKDTLDKKKIERSLMSLCEKVSGRLRKENFKGRTVTLKIRLEGFKTYTRAVTAGIPTNFTNVLYKQIKNLYNGFDTRGKKVRLVGVSVSNLSPINSRERLFRESVDEKIENIHKAVDEIKEKFGDGSICRGSSAGVPRMLPPDARGLK